MVVSQLALSFVLLIGAGLMVRTLIQLQKVDQGFDSENVVTMALATPFTRPFPETVPFYERLVERVRGFPGVEAAAVDTEAPAVTAELVVWAAPAAADSKSLRWET